MKSNEPRVDRAAIIAALDSAADALPKCHEKVIILTMIANLYAGVSNETLSGHAARISQQILNDIR